MNNWPRPPNNAKETSGVIAVGWEYKNVRDVKKAGGVYVIG